MKNDAAPIEFRRPFVALARAILPAGRVLEALRARRPPAHIADLLPKFHVRDLQPPWGRYYNDLRHAYAAVLYRNRVRKAAEPLKVPQSERARRWIDARAGVRCVEISRQQHEVVRLMVAEGYRKNLRPEDLARQLKWAVPLLPQHAAAVEKFKAQVRDDQGDAAAEEQGDRYAAKLLTYRTENIARTESHDAVENGRLFEWQDARDAGELPRDQKKVWVSAPASARLCDACQEMDGQEVDLDEDFYSDELGISVPAPTLHPSCRCTTTLAT